MFNLNWSRLRLVGIHDAPTGHVPECTFDVTGPQTQLSERANTPFSEHVSGEEACSLVTFARIISPFSYFQSPFPILARAQLYPVSILSPWPLGSGFEIWSPVCFGCLGIIHPFSAAGFGVSASALLQAGGTPGWVRPVSRRVLWAHPPGLLVLLHSRNHRAPPGQAMSAFCIE